MSQELLNIAAQSSMKEKMPSFGVGDTVNVSVRIIEGEKERTQIFSGTVIGKSGSGISETFRVRRIVNGLGVERVFPIHSPRVSGVEVVRGGQIRRAKLYFLRKRVGKSTRLKDVKIKPKAQKTKPVAPSAADDKAAAVEV